jgi:hypothetical protein
MSDSSLVERRRQFRLPYNERVIFTDGQKSFTSYGANISRGGLFATSLDPYPIDTIGHIAFFLPSQTNSLCVKAKVAHISFDRQRCEIECGMGFQFMELTDSQKSILNLHILNEQRTYQELKKLLAATRPDSLEISKCLKNMPTLNRLDLLGLRYKVNRICTIFEASTHHYQDDSLTA